MPKMNDSKGIRELTPMERNAVISIRHQLLEKHSFNTVSSESDENRIKRNFEQEAMGRLAEIGLVSNVHWEPEVYEMLDGTTKLVWEPELIISDRINGQGDVIDFERIKHEVRAGEADGIAGVIDPNTGEMKEDPKSKDIF